MVKTQVELGNCLRHNIRYPSSRMEGLMAINKRHEMGAQVRNAMLKKKNFLCPYRYKIRYCCFSNLWKFQQFKSIPYSINSHTTKHWNNIATRLNGWDHIVEYDCCFQCTKINDHCRGNYFPKGSYKVLPIRLMYTSYSIDILHFPVGHISRDKLPNTNIKA